MIELQTGVISAWKLYECTSNLINCEQSQLFVTIVQTLATNIGKIHNLEMRCWVLEQVSFVLNRLSYQYERGMYEEIVCLSELIDDFANTFNEKYDKLFKILLQLFWEEDYRYMEWQKDESEVIYENLLGQIKKLKEKQNLAKCIRVGVNVNPIVKNKFADLYHSDSKTNRYQWYHAIWYNINQRQEWIFKI